MIEKIENWFRDCVIAVLFQWTCNLHWPSITNKFNKMTQNDVKNKITLIS